MRMTMAGVVLASMVGMWNGGDGRLVTRLALRLQHVKYEETTKRTGVDAERGSRARRLWEDTPPVDPVPDVDDKETVH